MKIVLNNKTTKFDVGDFLVNRYAYRYHKHPTFYKIVAMIKCRETLYCHRCTSGYIAYDTRRFARRLGTKQCVICSHHSKSLPEWYRVNPITREIIYEEGEESAREDMSVFVRNPIATQEIQSTGTISPTQTG